MKLRKDKFVNKELEMNEICMAGATSKTTAGNQISRTTLDRASECPEI